MKNNMNFKFKYIGWDLTGDYFYAIFTLKEVEDFSKVLSWGRCKNIVPGSIVRLLGTGLKDKRGKGKEIYQGDIVRVWADRLPKYENSSRSQYDIRKIEVRAVIIFNGFKFKLDCENEFNKKILALKGKETEERTLTIRKSLSNYNHWDEWNKEHNSHAYWRDIEILGNIYGGPSNKILIGGTYEV